MKNKIIGLLFISILALTSFVGAQEYTDPQQKISFTIPTGWKEVAGPKGTFLALEKNTDDVRSFMLFFADKTTVADTNLAALTKEEQNKLIDSEKKSLQASGAKLEIISVDINQWGDHSFLISKISVPEKGYKFSHTTFAKSQTIYSINFLTDNKENDFDSEYKELLKSIRFLK